MAQKDHKCPTCGKPAASTCQMGRQVFWECPSTHRWGNLAWTSDRHAWGKQRAPAHPALERTEIALLQQIELRRSPTT